MKMLTNNGGIEDRILNAIEQFWNFGLPKDYREFLVKYNGGEPLEKVFYFKNSKDFGGCMTEFFGFVNDYNNNLLINASYSGDRILDTMLAIADEACGNLILLTVTGQDRNKVYFWDHEMEADTENGEKADYSNLTLIADSFTDFVESLRDIDRDE